MVAGVGFEPTTDRAAIPLDEAKQAHESLWKRGEDRVYTQLMASLRCKPEAMNQAVSTTLSTSSSGDPVPVAHADRNVGLSRAPRADATAPSKRSSSRALSEMPLL